MNIKEIARDYDTLVQELRDYVYGVCSSQGTEVPATEEEGGYFVIEREISVHAGLKSMSEIRAYIGEGWIYIKPSRGALIDFSELSADVMLSIAEAI